MLEIQVSLCLSEEVDLSRSLKNKIKTAMERAEGACSQTLRGKGVSQTVSVWWEVGVAIQPSLWEIRLPVGHREGTNTCAQVPALRCVLHKGPVDL